MPPNPNSHSVTDHLVERRFVSKVLSMRETRIWALLAVSQALQSPSKPGMFQPAEKGTYQTAEKVRTDRQKRYVPAGRKGTYRPSEKIRDDRQKRHVPAGRTTCVPNLWARRKINKFFFF